MADADQRYGSEMCPRSFARAATDVQGDPGPAVFVLADDPLVEFHQTLEMAAGLMEAIDVEAGEYRGAWTLDGRAVEISVGLADVVQLSVTTERDEEGLRAALDPLRTILDLPVSIVEPAAVADELLRRGDPPPGEPPRWLIWVLDRLARLRS